MRGSAGWTNEAAAGNRRSRTALGAGAVRLLLALLVGMGVAGAFGGRAYANGNYTHLWVAADAVGHLEDGELKELLSHPELLETMRNGANFPDGGYAVGDGYGEIGHWEPFQTLYLEWIRDTYGAPWSDEGKKHVAFLMGMAAHGMTDQLFDGMYLERHYVFDQNSASGEWGNIDGVTDICFAAKMGPMEVPVSWVPAEVMAMLFAKAGHAVTPEMIETGQSLVAVAVMYTNDKSKDEATVSKYMELYPWACGHQDDPLVPGSPVSMGPAIARYWEVLWGRLNGDDGFDQPLLGTWFGKGMPWEQPRDAGSPDSWVSFAVPRGLNKSTVTDQSVLVSGPGGLPHPVDLQLYYGNASHLVNIRPKEDWALDAAYTVTISAPLASWDGVLLEGTREFEFSTGEAPIPVDEGPVEGDVAGGDVHGEDSGAGDLATALDSVDNELSTGKDVASADDTVEVDKGGCGKGPGESCGGNRSSGCSAGGRGGKGGRGSSRGTTEVVVLVGALLAMVSVVGRMRKDLGTGGRAG